MKNPKLSPSCTKKLKIVTTDLLPNQFFPDLGIFEVVASSNAVFI